MNDTLFTILITVVATLPIGAVIGWFADRLFTPTVHALGVRLQVWLMTRFSKDEYSTYIAYSNLHKLVSDLHKRGHNNFSDHKPYLYDHSINLEIKSKTNGQLRNIANMWTHQTAVHSYAESDIFFAGMELLLKLLNKKNVRNIFRKHKDNSQAVGLWLFLETVEEKYPDLLSIDALQYLRGKQREWNTICARQEEEKKRREERAILANATMK